MFAARLHVLGIAGTAAVCVCAPTARAQGRGAARTARAPHTDLDVSDRMLRNARDDRGKNWLMYGRDYTNQRWSPLAQIDTGNVRHVRLAWTFQTGTSRLASLETSPVVADSMMYITAPYDVVMAVDARTGQSRWRYEHKLGASVACCGPANRGVAISQKSVYLLTLDAQLVALDAATGAVRFAVQVADPAAGYGETSAPIVIDDRVVIGVSGSEYGIRGFVQAYNKHTGQLIWQTSTIPDQGWTGRWSEQTGEGEPLHRDIPRERADSAKYDKAWQHGGGAVWMNAAIDPSSKTMYVAVGNPSPERDGTVRPGDNLYTDCILALDLMTGAVKWYYQEVPHDVWGLDASSPPVIVTLKDGGTAIAEAGKTGWVYLLDAASGRLIRKSAPFVRQDNIFAAPTAAGVRILPGANGGSEWSPMSVNPLLGYAYVAGINEPMVYRARAGGPAPAHDAPHVGSAVVAPEQPRDGTLTAIDLNTGRVAWQDKLPQPMIGGSLATAGNLVFVGEGRGRFDAANARTGRMLWHFDAGAGCNAPPISYELDGTQFVAVACGGNSQLAYPLGDAVLVFSLPPAEGASPMSPGTPPPSKPATRSPPSRRRP